MESMRYWTRVRVWMAVAAGLGAALCSLAFASVSSAAPQGVVGYFGNPSGLHSFLAGEFNTVQSVAVNSTGAGPADAGDVYVVDQGNSRVQRFSALGQFELMWGRDVIRPNPDVESDAGVVFERCSFALDCKAGVNGSLGGEFVTPRGVAVDQLTGNVYVVDRHNAAAPNGGVRVQAFTGDGEFLWALGKDVITNGSSSDPTNITTTQVCTVAADCKAAAIGTAGGEFGAGGTNTATGGGNGIAVSPIPNGITGAGNVLVTDRANRRVQEFTSTGSFVRAFGWDTITNASPSDPGSVTTFQVCTVAADCKDGAAAGAEAGRFGANAPNRVAVDSAGAIYTVENSSNFRLQKFTPQVGPPELSPAIINPNIGGATTLTGTATSSTPMDVAVGPSDHVYVLRAFAVGAGTPPAVVAERRVVELDNAGALIDTHAALAGVGGAVDVAINTATTDIYMSTASPPSDAGEGVYVLGPPPPAPTVSLGVGGVGSHTAQLNGLVGPGGPGTLIGIRTRYRLEYRKVGAPSWTALSADKDAGNGFGIVPVGHALTDLEANTAYEARLVAYRPFSGLPNSITAPEMFTTQASRPDIDSVYVTGRSQTSATLNARINPNGSATSYRFEYGPTAAYGTTIPVPDAGAGNGVTSLIFSEAISGLSPDTTYHYRLIATNANGANTSPDHTFSTRPDPSPDPDRAYELVSPADKTGGTGVSAWYAGIGSHGNTGVPAYDGDRYSSISYYGGSLADGGFSYGADATLGERTFDGWINKPAFNKIGGLGTSEFAKIPTLYSMSDDLSLTAWNAQSQLAIFPEQQAVWGNQLGAAKGQALRDWTTGRWEITAPLQPDQQVAGDVTTQVAADGGYALVSGRIRGVAGGEDPTHAAFAGGPSDLFCPDIASCNRNVYIDDVTAGLSDSYPGDGIRSLVNVCTGDGADRTEIPRVDGSGKLVPATCPGVEVGRDARLISPRGASVAGNGSLPGHISDDGSRIFFMSPDHMNTANNVPCVSVNPDVAGTRCPPQVYVWQRNDDGTFTTRWISKSKVAGQDATLTAPVVFEGATPDGDKVFFRTASPLTPDDPNGGTQQPGGVKTGTPNSTSVDLFMYDFPDADAADPGEGSLTRISAGPAGTGDANVSTDPVETNTSALRAFGNDGSRVYFVTAAPLAGVPAPASGTITSPGGTVSQTTTRNLYLYNTSQSSDPEWRFVAQLPANSPLGSCGTRGSLSDSDGLETPAGGLTETLAPTSSANCMRSTGDASFISLFSDGRLTADDPDSVTGDVYAYDAVSDTIARVSATQNGAGGSYQCVTDSGAGFGTRCHGDPFIASLATRAPLNMITVGSSGEQAMFFESASRLVPEDENDVYDVYQWHNGALSLLSTGAADAEPTLYRGNDRTGTNVYISTRDRLSWQDHDAVLDVYAVRVGGGFDEPAPPPGCSVLLITCRGDGAGEVALPSVASGSGADNGGVSVRATLSIKGVSRHARARAARSGVLRIGVRSSSQGLVTAVAKARIGRHRKVGVSTVRVGETGHATLVLRLSRVARKRLASGKSLSLSVRVSLPGARGRSMQVRLPGVER